MNNHVGLTLTRPTGTTFSFGNWPSSEPEERKQKKKEQQRLKGLEGAQAKTTKYATKYAVNVFKVIFAFNYYNKIIKITFCFFKKMYNKIKRECFEIKFYKANRLPCLGCQMFKKWPFKLGRMYPTAHQNDRFNALRLCCSKLNPACLCSDSKPAKLHKARWATQLLNHLLRLPNRASSRHFQERSSAVTFILKFFPYRIVNLLNISSEKIFLDQEVNKQNSLHLSNSFWEIFYKSNRNLFSCVCIAWYKHSRGWEYSRQLCKP